jgi:hypothetical protein
MNGGAVCVSASAAEAIALRAPCACVEAYGQGERGSGVMRACVCVCACVRVRLHARALVVSATVAKPCTTSRPCSSGVVCHGPLRARSALSTRKRAPNTHTPHASAACVPANTRLSSEMRAKSCTSCTVKVRVTVMVSPTLMAPRRERQQAPRRERRERSPGARACACVQLLAAPPARSARTNGPCERRTKASESERN